MHSRVSVGPRMEPWGTPGLTGYSHPKSSITEKWPNKAIKTTIRFEYVKKTIVLFDTHTA